MNFSPSIPVNVSGKDLLTDPLSVDYQHRRITITGEITDDKAAVINASLRYLAGVNNDDIVIYINSPGGSVTAGLSIYDAIKASHCDICTVATGMAASMAAFLLITAGTKGKRFATANAEVMIHQPLGGVQGQASDISIVAQHILRVKNKINAILAESTGNDVNKIEVDTDRDKWFTATQALEYGMIDKIGDPFSEEEDA